MYPWPRQSRDSSGAPQGEWREKPQETFWGALPWPSFFSGKGFLEWSWGRQMGTPQVSCVHWNSSEGLTTPASSRVQAPSSPLPTMPIGGPGS